VTSCSRSHLGSARSGPSVVAVWRRVPGRPVGGSTGGPPPRLFTGLLPALVDAVERQRGLGDLADPPWPHWLLTTIDVGGEGYCLHDTMRRRADTAMLLDRLTQVAARHRAGPVRTNDVVHFDLNPANVLHVSGRLSAIVDWNIPAPGTAQGDRGFDLATLLFYGYGIESVRDRLWPACLAISGRWTAVYLSHLVLRQVEWTARHRPGSTDDDRFVALGSRVLDDCQQRLG
jgi:hypothetical protein